MKILGQVVLAAWLILHGLKAVVGLNFHYDNLVLGVMAIVAGIFVAVRY